LTLADLQRIAQTSSPQLREAAAAVESAKGAAIQAGLYPNPTLGLTGTMPIPSSPGSVVGSNISQTIIMAGKLKLAQASAMVDLKTSQIAYRRAATDLMYNVRTSYFAVLVALEEMGEMRAVAELTDTMYNVWVRQLKGGEVATYEPMQGGVFAIQARAALVTARNSYTLAWKQLASAIGLPAMPPTEVVGDIEKIPLPIYRYDAVLAHVLANHTDMLTAQVGIDKARYQLGLQQVQVFPDPTATMGAVYDNTQPGPYRVGGTLGISVAIPVWNLNQGAIYQAQGSLIQAIEEPHRVRTALTASVADAFRRYEENRVLLKLFREQALPKQVQAFRAAVKRHYAVGPGEAAPVAYTDLVSAEQNLVTVVGTYGTYLAAQWQAVADVANFLQTNDIFQVAERLEPPSEVDLRKLLELPDCHPCSPLRDPALRGADVNWPYTGWDRPDSSAPASTGKEQTGKATSAPRSLAAGNGTDHAPAAVRFGAPQGVVVPSSLPDLSPAEVPTVNVGDLQNRRAGL
jgi:cobalt-zinc-cadmium efflux system outer membrane protein